MRYPGRHTFSPRIITVENRKPFRGELVKELLLRCSILLHGSMKVKMLQSQIGKERRMKPDTKNPL